jgi:RES domain-containing protein
MPRVFVGISFKLKSVLDLTESKVRRRLGFSLNELLTEDWRALQENGEESWTQAIGRGASSASFEGILVPSAQDRNGTNIVIFPGNLARSGAIELMGKDQLPKHP